MVPEMPGTTLEIRKVHCQAFRQPLVETCPSVDCRTQDKDWKTNKHMGCANTNVLPIAHFGRMEGNCNADTSLADTYGLIYLIFDTLEIRLLFVVSLRPCRAAFGQTGSTSLSYIPNVVPCGCATHAQFHAMVHSNYMPWWSNHAA